eukprot:2697778-Amphidinium_carterae.1
MGTRSLFELADVVRSRHAPSFWSGSFDNTSNLQDPTLSIHSHAHLPNDTISTRCRTADKLRPTNLDSRANLTVQVGPATVGKTMPQTACILCMGEQHANAAPRKKFKCCGPHAIGPSDPQAPHCAIQQEVEQEQVEQLVGRATHLTLPPPKAGHL